MQGKIPARPLETPGAFAWLNFELRRYRDLIADPTKARLYGEVAQWQDTRSVPPFFLPLRQLSGEPVRQPAALPVLISPDPLHDPPRPFALRAQSFLELDHHWFAMTRRAALESGEVANPSILRIDFSALPHPHLLSLASTLPRNLADHPLPALPGSRAPRVVRLYALSEDGTLVSLPVTAEPFDPAENRRAALSEGRGFRDSPERPTFVSNEFYFRFDYGAPAGDQTFYSGLYLDLGGQGLVATITVPLRDAGAGAGERGLVGADLTFDIDWEAFARASSRR